MRGTEVLRARTDNEISRIAKEMFDAKLRSLGETKEKALEILRQAADAGQRVHIRREMLRRFRIGYSDTDAALHSLTLEGRVELDADYLYRLAPCDG